MRKIHLIFDYSPIYYKYVYFLKNGWNKKLTYGDKDVTMIYLTIRDIVDTIKRVKSMASKGGKGVAIDTVVSIAFDSKTNRKDEDSDYKGRRKSVLTDEDFDNILEVRELLEYAGFNTYKVDGYEADDIIYQLVNNNKHKFDNTVVFTTDRDMLVNVDKECRVGVWLNNSYKKEYNLVTVNNFEEFVESKFDCEIPFNAIMLYKATVGDKSDNISGIKGFGNKAFDKMIDHLYYEMDFLERDFEEMVTWEKVESVLESLTDFLGVEKVGEALHSLNLVKPREISISEPNNRITSEKLNNAVSKYEFVSLYNSL